MERTDWITRWTLAGVGGAIVGYCILVMVVVATAPDLRMRFLLVGDVEKPYGIVIEKTIGLRVLDGSEVVPEEHDTLLMMDDKPVATSVDFMRYQFDLRNWLPRFDQEQLDIPRPAASDGVKITFRKHGSPAIHEARVKIQSVPMSDVGMTLVWFLLELIIFSVSAVAFWNRPFDDSARLFFAMCTVTLAAFVGGFHWWTIGSSYWLILPFAICGILLPAVILHFFLVYPRPKPPLIHWPKTVISLIYAVPVAAIVTFVAVDGFLWLVIEWTDHGSVRDVAIKEMRVERREGALRIPAQSSFAIGNKQFVYVVEGKNLELREVTTAKGTSDYLTVLSGINQNERVVTNPLSRFKKEMSDLDKKVGAGEAATPPMTIDLASSTPSEVKRTLLNWLRLGIYSYICLAALYFVIALVALANSWLTTRNPVERNQVRWILLAGCAASFFIGFDLYLAFVHREYFVLGGGRWPMFLASLVFMFAYAVGIVRYKLMLIDQIVNRGMSYYVMSFGATGAIALLISWSALTLSSPNSVVREQPTRIIAGILTVAVILLLWLRDSWQDFVDRRFFREKYRLDKALQRINQAVGRLADVDFLSQRMLTSCRDALQSELVAIYLREGTSNVFRLVGAEGDSGGLPMQFTAPDEFFPALEADPTLQRVTAVSRDTMTPIQRLLRLVKADLIHALETNGEITGIVVLGSKLSGLMYSAEDLTFLTALGQITGIALHSAKVHQSMKDLNEELRVKVDQVAQQRQQIAILQAEVATQRVEPGSTSVIEFRRESIIGHSAELARVLDMVRKVAPSESSVLVRGESGTGKELLAKAIHENSPRRGGPLVSVHCAALSSGLLESELFGHVKGAFTGAHSDKQGRFELANGGTLFLDEIGDISAETQVKLLRVLQQREFEPVGGTKTIKTDVRLIAATHQNLERLIAEGKFREDLFYRLNVISIALPPLRERPEDILDLAVFFLKSASTRGGKRISRFNDDALNALMRYSWPGNIRELQNVIERAVVLAEHEMIEISDLPFDLQNPTPTIRPVRAQVNSAVIVGGATSVWNDDDPESERRQLVEALRQCGGNKTKAARRLGLPRSTYFSKLKKYGIDEDDLSDPSRISRIPR